MNPQSQLLELLQKHHFDLVRQRKHKIYRNSDGLTFVTASTPSDRHASQNALSTLRRILRPLNPPSEPIPLIEPTPLFGTATSIEVASVAEIKSETKGTCAAISDQQWEAWKRQYWHDEKLRAKNERFLSAVDMYVDRVSDLLHKREDVRPLPATDAVKSILRRLQYKSKVLLYNCAFFEKGGVITEARDQPILWASNGHIGISAFLFCNGYVQHGPSRVPELRFEWEGMPVLFELPEGARKFHSS